MTDRITTIAGAILAGCNVLTAFGVKQEGIGLVSAIAIAVMGFYTNKR